MRLNPRLADGRQQIERAWRTANAPAPPNAGTGPKRHKAERQKKMSGEEMTQIRAFPMSESPVIPLRERRRSEEHTSALQSLMRISFAVFCLNKYNTYY